MKILLLSLILALAGCQSVPAPLPPARPAAKPAPMPRPVVAASPAAAADPALDLKIRQQAQYIEALISQNDALMAKLHGSPAPVTPTPLVALVPPPATAPAPRPAITQPDEALALAPNADGVVDLAAASLATKLGEPVNPFTVRTVLAEAVREVTLKVGGIIAGPVACAVINDRLVQTGESVESLAVERIDPAAVILRHGGQRLRLPVSEKPVRVRLPL